MVVTRIMRSYDEKRLNHSSLQSCGSFRVVRDTGKTSGKLHNGMGATRFVQVDGLARRIAIAGPCQ